MGLEEPTCIRRRPGTFVAGLLDWSERATSSRNSKPLHGCPEQELMSSMEGAVNTVAGASGTGEEWVWLYQGEE